MMDERFKVAVNYYSKRTIILIMKRGSERLHCAESKLHVHQFPNASAIFNCWSHTGGILLHVKPPVDSEKGLNFWMHHKTAGSDQLSHPSYTDRKDR